MSGRCQLWLPGGYLAQGERRTTQPAVTEPAYRTPEPHGDPVIVEILDHGEFALKVPRPYTVGEHHSVADAKLGDRGRGADGKEQFAARVDRVGDRDEMLIKFAGGDLL